MAFYIGTDKVIEDTDASAGISTSSNLDKLQINGTDVLTHDGTTITLKNVDISVLISSTIDTDDLTEGSTNLFYTSARQTAIENYTDAAEALAISTSNAYTDTRETAITAAYTTAIANSSSSGSSAANTYTDTAIANLIDTAPATLDTLNELAAALGDDPNFATTVTNQIAALTHDGFADYVANEHIDWTTDQGATNIHAGNYTNTTYVSSDFNHDDLTGFVANEHIDWTAASAGTIDPSNYTNTGDTTYTAGDGIGLSSTEFSVAAGNGLTQEASGLAMSGSYTGDFTATGDVTAYSDQRLKRNVETISNAVDLVNCLRGVNFEKDGRHSTGVIAQEVEEFLPEVVHTDAEGMKSVAYGNITGLLIEAIKEQQQTIENLQKQISDIQSSKE